MDTQELILHVQADGGPHAEAAAMALTSQASTLVRLNMRHDAMPPHYLGALGSLQSLENLYVRDLSPRVRKHPRWNAACIQFPA